LDPDPFSKQAKKNKNAKNKNLDFTHKQPWRSFLEHNLRQTTKTKKKKIKKKTFVSPQTQVRHSFSKQPKVMRCIENQIAQGRHGQAVQHGNKHFQGERPIDWTQTVKVHHEIVPAFP
jgi:hypothetical protein